MVLERPLSVPPARGRSSLLPALSVLYTPTAAWRLPLAIGARRAGGQCPGSPSPMTDGSSPPAGGRPAVYLQPPQGPMGGPDSPWGFGSCPHPRPPHRCSGIPPQQLSLRDPPKHASPPPAGLSVSPTARISLKHHVQGTGWACLLAQPSVLSDPGIVGSGRGDGCVRRCEQAGTHRPGCSSAGHLGQRPRPRRPASPMPASLGQGGWLHKVLLT